MQLFAARIALLAYLVGGLAIPAAHQYGWVHQYGWMHGAAGDSHRNHSHAGHSHRNHSHAGHSHGGHSHGDSSPAASDCAAVAPAAEGCCPTASDRAARQGVAWPGLAVAATVPQDAACGEDCVVCGFTGSAQAPLPEAQPVLLATPPLRAVVDSCGPGFGAADLRVDRLRGPPRDVLGV